MQPRVSVLVSALLLLAFMVAPPTSHALEPTIPKLHGRATTPQVGNQFGFSVAVSNLFLLVGEIGNDDVASDAGAAHLYDARSGRYLRKLTADDGTSDDFFGYSVALCGNLAVVGAVRAAGDDGQQRHGLDVLPAGWRGDPSG